jgi:hypothetical protein
MPIYVCNRCRFGELEWAFHGWGDLPGYKKAFRKAVEEIEIRKLIEGVVDE